MMLRRNDKLGLIALGVVVAACAVSCFLVPEGLARGVGADRRCIVDMNDYCPTWPGGCGLVPNIDCYLPPPTERRR